jgi:predicted transcriptional regulator
MASSGMLRRMALVTTLVVHISPILVTLMKEALSSSETSALARAIRRNIAEDTILHCHRRENFKSYIRHLVHIYYGEIAHENYSMKQ